MPLKGLISTFSSYGYFLKRYWSYTCPIHILPLIIKDPKSSLNRVEIIRRILLNIYDEWLFATTFSDSTLNSYGKYEMTMADISVGTALFVQKLQINRYPKFWYSNWILSTQFLFKLPRGKIPNQSLTAQLCVVDCFTLYKEYKGNPSAPQSPSMCGFFHRGVWILLRGTEPTQTT